MRNISLVPWWTFIKEGINSIPTLFFDFIEMLGILFTLNKCLSDVPECAESSKIISKPTSNISYAFHMH